MKKIESIRRFICGYEEYRLSELYEGGSFRTEKLPINVFMAEHRKFGNLLINTGCSNMMKKNPLSYSKYLSKHKVSFDKRDMITEHLARDHMDPLCIKKVLLTHANAECCGALPLLPKYELLSTAQLLCVLKFDNDSDHILKSTLPPDNIPMKAFNVFKGTSVLKKYFKFVYDVLGDGSILAADISGAANSMVGYFITEENIFFCADAMTDERCFDDSIKPTDKLLLMQYDSEDYMNVRNTLKNIHTENPDIRFIFSHSKDF